MHTCNRWQNGCWSAGLVLLLAGCGQTEAPKAPSGDAPPAAPQALTPAVVEPAAATDKPAAKPATLAEIRQAIDWLKFPKPDGAMWEMTDLRGTHFWMPGTFAQAADFYRKTMTAQGWSENKKAHPDAEPDKYQSFEFTRAGFLVDMSLTGKNKYVVVRLFHAGNVDARRLPQPADAKAAEAHRHYVSYATASKPESAAEFCRKEIVAVGWRETPEPEAKFAAKEGKTLLRFVQNAMECKVTITSKKEGATEVVYWTYFAREFDPADVAADVAAKAIPRPATVKEALQTLDLRKLAHLGESAPKINTGLHVVYEPRASVATAVAFYRKTLAEQGWTLVPPLVDLDERGALEFEKAGFHLSLRIENLIDQVNKTGLVKIEITNHGNVDLRQLPYLPGTEIGHDPQYSTQLRASTTAREAAAFYRKELFTLGWQDKGKGLDRLGGYDSDFFQNDSRLKLYIEKTRDGQTAIHMRTELVGAR